MLPLPPWKRLPPTATTPESEILSSPVPSLPTRRSPLLVQVPPVTVAVPLLPAANPR